MAAPTALVPPPKHLIDNAVNAALEEDLGLAGDITTKATVLVDAQVTAILVSRQAGVIAGLDLACAAFHTLDPNLSFTARQTDGARTSASDTVAEICGNARAILTAERVALNFLGHLSGIATLTRAYVDATAETNVSIVDTRKTTPGLRSLEKYAVRCGGGHNHRSGLFDAVLIKDNHIAAAGSIEAAIAAAKANAGHLVKIEVEVDTLDQLKAALDNDIDAVLLDNMSCDDLRKAVAMASGAVVLEASGGVTLETVKDIAATGVDLISVGALTHSAPCFDFGLDF